MNLSSKLKLTVVAASVLLSGAANAAVEPNGIVFFAANGSSTSVMFDLGLTLANFHPADSVSPAFLNHATDLAKSKIVWDLDGSTVSITGPASSTTIGVDYTGIWSKFSFSENSKWGVIGADEALGDIVTTTRAAVSDIESMSGPQITVASADVPNVYINQNNVLLSNSTHSTADNGASFVNDGTSSALHANGFGAFDDWRSNAKYSAAVTGAFDDSGALERLPVYYVGYNGAGNTRATVFEGAYFTFDSATAELTYNPIPIPEPSTYALMGVGLLAVGALARRRARR